MNLKEWAEEQGVASVTARRWVAAGQLPVPAYRVGGLILIGTPVTGAKDTGSTVVHARASSGEQRTDLDRQVARVTGWATGQHLSVDRVATEVGSALNGHRCKVDDDLVRDVTEPLTWPLTWPGVRRYGRRTGGEASSTTCSAVAR